MACKMKKGRNEKNVEVNEKQQPGHTKTEVIKTQGNGWKIDKRLKDKEMEAVRIYMQKRGKQIYKKRLTDWETEMMRT